MPAKDVSSYLRQAIHPLVAAEHNDWELIVVEDHSSDDTLAILKDAEKHEPRIKVVTNKGSGKVLALNYGYTLTSGDIIKCIDADDVLSPTFFEHLDDFRDYDAGCHNSYVTTNDLKVICEYSINRAFFRNSFDYCLNNLASLPRCLWSFKRHIGNIIFPMPEDLPFEDVWFSLIIKKYAGASIRRIHTPLYYYRQHSNQAYGGILNFNDRVVAFRAKRMLKFIDVIKRERSGRLLSAMNNENCLGDIRAFYTLLAGEKLKLGQALLSDIPLSLKLRLLLYKKLNWLAPSLTRLRWLLDKQW
jgi:glycosyltransferase involved in cell wall biosynthesis